MRRSMVSVVATAVTLLALAVAAGPAAADFGIDEFDGAVSNADGTAFTQAGGHPYEASTVVTFNRHDDPGFPGFPPGLVEVPDADVKDVLVDLPPGLVGNPGAFPACTAAQLVADGGFGKPPLCPIESQVGIAKLMSNMDGIGLEAFAFPVYKMEAPAGVPARFAFIAAGALISLDAEVRKDDGYAITVASRNASAALKLWGVKVTLWGVPADPGHDAQRCLQSGLGLFGPDYECFGAPGSPQGPHSVDSEPVAFLSNPTACTAPGEGLTTTVRASSWQDPDVFDTASFESHLPPGYPADPSGWGAPQGPTGCDDLPFGMSMTAQPTTSRADAPSGFEVELSMSQAGLTNPAGLATAHLKRAQVALPEGMRLNPGSANGLGACSPAEIDLDEVSRPSCPDSSKIGTVDIETPLLDEPLAGSVFLAEQASNPFGSLLALYLHAEGHGVQLKLAGKVEPDPDSGRLVTSFDDNPQLPFTSLRMRLKGGDRASLITPAECGSYESVGEFSPWSAADPGNPTPSETVTATDSFSIDQGCAPAGFDPGFDGGAAQPTAGAFSPFAMRVTRTGANQKELGRFDVSPPEGMVADLSKVDVCSEAALAAATGKSGRVTQGSPGCPAGSQVGTTTVGAGAGALYYPLIPGSEVSGRVFLTGPHPGAPAVAAGASQAAYGLAVEVPAVAGPFDLGTVLVRAAIYVDPATAQLTVVSDKLPRILQGIPLDVRDVRVDVDRSKFTVTPTACDPTTVGAVIRAQDDTAASRSSRFQVGDCSRLGLTPKLGMRLTGRGQTKTGGHPALRSRLTQPKGQSNISRARITLPKSVVLDPKNASDPALLCPFDKGQQADCPASSIIGQASAVSPLLKRPLRGPVYFVQGIKTDPRTGRQIRTLPTLLVELDGEVKLDVRAKSSVNKRNQLVTTFPIVPDAQVSSFRLNLKGGKQKGILVVTGSEAGNISLCDRPQNAGVAIRGHNGKLSRQTTRIKTPCAKKAKRKRLNLTR